MKSTLVSAILLCTVACTGCGSGCPGRGCPPASIELTLRPVLLETGDYTLSVDADGMMYSCTTQLPSRSADGTDDTCSENLSLRSAPVSTTAGASESETAGTAIAGLFLNGRFRRMTVAVRRDGQLITSRSMDLQYEDQKADKGECGACPVAHTTLEIP